MAYCVIRTDLMAGTKNPDQLVSLRYYADEAVAEVENGVIVELKGYEDGQREVMKAVAATDASDMADCAVIAAPEVMYDERKRNLDEFQNAAGAIARGYHLHTNDIFSVTVEALTCAATPEVGDVVELDAGTKLKVVASATEGSTVVGSIIDINVVGRYSYYVIQVA